MFFEQPLADGIASGVILATITVFWVIFIVRVVGLRTFSKMTAFDFVVTVATGSLLAGASQSSEWPAFVQSLAAIAALLGVQYIMARLRIASSTVETVVQNAPVLLMRDGEIFDDALRATRVAKDDLVAKLREANVLDYSEVRAVVLETTGDISVLHGPTLQESLLDGTRRVQ
ncbi:DUF421 domain-containing protein [Heliomarina baculiformis]|uniref:DUF421 domain-containing protein n=1 Tax=Heliomarina baculiformis TaxID=2872036 RepID=UPI001EE294A4|nr:YetF domain-containing protein [Heliomarina baculiformis]